MRKPRDIKRYTTPEKAAQWLEGLAANIRKNDGGNGDVIALDVTLKCWNPSWATKPKGKK